MKLKQSKLTVGQLVSFTYNVRRKDLEEFWIPDHKSFRDTSIVDLNSASCLYDEETNDVYCIWGLVDTDSIEKIVWMLCTEKVEEHPIAFLRYSISYLKQLLENNRILVNYVWLGNDLHVKWLKWMGAKFGEIIQLNGEPFQYFYFMKE